MAINKNDFKNAEGNYEAKNALMDAVIDGVNGNETNGFMPKVMPVGADFNDLYGSGTSGAYALTSAGGYLNSATSNITGVLLVFATSWSTTAQMHITTGGQIYVRGRSTSTWYAWREVTTEAV